MKAKLDKRTYCLCRDSTLYLYL